MDKIARGKSIEDLRTNLTDKNVGHEVKEHSRPVAKSEVPDDLVQVQAFIRWEKAGKPNYSPEQQLVNFQSFSDLSSIILLLMVMGTKYIMWFFNL